MKKILLLLMLVGGMVGQAGAWSKVNQVWASGNTVYGRAILSGNDMPGVGHTFTVKTRITSPTGRTTGWVQKITTNNLTNDLTIPMGLSTDYGNWVFEAQYNVFCPKGLLNSTETASSIFEYGHSTNCFYIIPNTQQVISTYSGPKWYALYAPAVGCKANCMANNPYGALSPYVPGSHPSAYINFKYTWVFLSLIGQRYCLEYYETGRNPCNSANCGDSTGF